MNRAGDKNTGAQRVVVLLYGRLGYRDGTYLHRRTISRYLDGLAREMGRMTLVARVTEVAGGEERLTVPLDSSLLEVHPIRVAAGRGAGPRVAWDALRVVRDSIAVSRAAGERPVVFAFAPGPLALAAALARRLSPFPLVAYFGIDWEGAEATVTTRRWRALRNRLLQGFIGRSADAALCAGEALFEKVGGWCGEAHRTVPILDLPRCGAGAPMQPRDPEEPFRFLYVGTLARRKGLAELVAATARLRAAGRSVELHLVGDGPQRHCLAASVRELGLEDRVRIHGYVSDRRELDRLYATCDAFVLPSFNEGFPRVLYEAAAVGLPIVATRVGGIPAVLEDGEHALLVAPGDVAALARAMDRVRHDHGLRRRMARRLGELEIPQGGRRAVEQHADVLRSVLRRWTP